MLSHLLYRHVAEGDDLDSDFTGHLVQRFGHLAVGFTEIDDAVVRADTPTHELIIKVAVGDEQSGSGFTDERMMEVQVALDHLHLRSRFVPPQHNGDASFLEGTDSVARRAPL